MDTSCPDWAERIKRGMPLVPALDLNDDEASRAVRVFNRLRLPDVAGMPTMEEATGDWFRDIVAALFGSYDPDAGLRGIQEVFLLVPKKNSKSTNAAAVMVVAMIVNRRPLAEFQLIAPTKEIADISFNQARGMINADPTLKRLFDCQRHIRTITHLKSEATLKIKAADTDAITGSKAVGTLIDEIHVFAEKTRAADVFTEIRGALAARPDGFLFQISTQSKRPPAGVFAKELRRAREVRDGKRKLPLLPVLYELPPDIAEQEGSWREPENFKLVNPNLGRSVSLDFLIRGVEDATAAGAEELALFASQHMNVEVGVGLQDDGWAGAKVWERGVDRDISTLADLVARSEVVCAGIDGGGLDDLLGFAVIGREYGTRRWLAWTHALISPEGMAQRKANQPRYQDFMNDGDLTLVENIQDDLIWLQEHVGLVLDSGKLAKVGVDPAGIGGVVDALDEIGVSEDEGLLTGVAQGIRLMNAAKTVERKLVDGSFKHGGTRLMAWCAGNAKVRATSTAMLIERAKSGYGKIDPLMALFNAAHLMGLNPEAGGSYLDTGELLVL